MIQTTTSSKKKKKKKKWSFLTKSRSPYTSINHFCHIVGVIVKEVSVSETIK